MGAGEPDVDASRWGPVPLPALLMLAVVLPIGPIGWVLSREDGESRARGATPLAAIARDAGCRLTEFRDGMNTNPPVTGRFDERIRAADGSYAGRRPPRLAATTHALFHGRVLFQYRRGLPGR